MYIVRDIFQLRYGHYRDVKELLDEAMSEKLMPEAKSQRILSDFTGNAYRLIFEEGFDSLAEYEGTLISTMRTDEWQKWYKKFKEHVESSHREILKVVM